MTPFTSRPGGVQKRSDLNASIEARFWSKVDKSGECWLWLGAKNNMGYGHISSGRKHPVILAHRVAFLLTYGEISDGAILRHTCDTPACVRPTHLLEGTLTDNARDTSERGRCRPWNRGLVRCKRNHPLTPETTFTYRGSRVCRECHRMHARENMQKLRDRRRGHVAIPE
jgi:hypothetical protein